MMIDWRFVVKNGENCFVSRFGDVYSLRLGRLLSQSWGGGTRCPYLQVRLGTTVKVHVLVAELWIGQRPNGLEICHKNGDRSNNAVTNLYYGTSKDNARDRRQHGTQVRGSRQGNSRLTEEQVRSILKDGRRQKVIAEEYGVSRATVCMNKKNGQRVDPTTTPDKDTTDDEN